MFILSLTYIKPIFEVEKLLDAHIAFLEKYYQTGNFICSGRKNPRTGGIILCNCKNTHEIQGIIQEDPFFINKVAEYELIEFVPSKYADAFSKFIKEKK